MTGYMLHHLFSQLVQCCDRQQPQHKQHCLCQQSKLSHIVGNLVFYFESNLRLPCCVSAYRESGMLPCIKSSQFTSYELTELHTRMPPTAKILVLRTTVNICCTCNMDIKEASEQLALKEEVRSSFITTTVWEQRPRSHHKGDTGRA